MATYWQRKCPSCGHTVSGRSTSYNGTTIGPPLTKCPECGHIQKIRTHREWIQMSVFTKMACTLNLHFISVIIIAAGAFAGIVITGLLEAPVVVRILAGILGLFAGFFAAYFIMVRTRAFLNAYAYSLHRTDSEEYRRMLNLPEPTGQMISVPLVTLRGKRAEAVAEIRGRERKASEYFSAFEEI